MRLRRGYKKMTKIDDYDLTTICDVLLHDGFSAEQIANMVAMFDEFAES